MTIAVMQLLVGAGSAAFLGWLATAVVRRWALRIGLEDRPNHRSLHHRVTPRGGGLAFLLSVPLTVAFARWWDLSLSAGIRPLWVGSLLVAAVSLADDRRALTARTRFTAHLAGAICVVVFGGVVREVSLPAGIVLQLHWAAYPLTLLWIVGLTNIYNFMDGIDGLAAGQAVVVATALGYLAHSNGADGIALPLAILAGAVLGFLVFNWPPASIFMGDVGSAFLGFSLASWAVLSGGVRSGPVPFLAWCAALAPFLLDASITLLRRVFRGERWYQAHREHFYQRLVQRGWSHLAVTTLYVSVSGLCAIAAIILSRL